MALRRHGNEAWQLHRINGALWIITLRAGQGWTQNALSLILLLLTRSYEIFDITLYVIIMSALHIHCAVWYPCRQVFIHIGLEAHVVRLFALSNCH